MFLRSFVPSFLRSFVPSFQVEGSTLLWALGSIDRAPLFVFLGRGGMGGGAGMGEYILHTPTQQTPSPPQFMYNLKHKISLAVSVVLDTLNKTLQPEEGEMTAQKRKTKPQKLLALPVIVCLFLPALLVFSILTSTGKAVISFVEDALGCWGIFKEWWSQ